MHAPEEVGKVRKFRRPNVKLKVQTYDALAVYARELGLGVPQLLALNADRLAATIRRKMAA